MCGPTGNRLKNMPDKADVAGSRLLADYFWLADEMVSAGPKEATQLRLNYPSSILAISMAATIIARITTIQFWNVKPRSGNCSTSQSSTLIPPTYYLMSAGPRQPCVWGSRIRPLPQPPTRSRAVTPSIDGIGMDGIPAFTRCGSGF